MKGIWTDIYFLLKKGKINPVCMYVFITLLLSSIYHHKANCSAALYLQKLFKKI